MLFEKIKINKKRLIRKAEFVDGFQHRDAETGMVSLYKNPTDSEISEAKAESMFKAIRGVILENGEIYCWNGDILHDDMSSKTKISMDGNVFRFACENNRWIFDLHDDIPFKIGFELCNNHKSTLERFGNINKSLQFFFGYTFQPLPDLNMFSLDFRELTQLGPVPFVYEQSKIRPILTFRVWLAF